MAIDVNNPKLLASGEKYRKELLMMPMLQLGDYANYMTRRMAIRGKETVGELSNAAGLRPYRTEKGAKDSAGLVFRTLETYLGDVVEEFDPYKLSNTIYGNSIGQQPENFDIVKATVLSMAKSVGKGLRTNLFKAKRNDAGDSTAELFDGFSTIVDAEITAGNIVVEKKNFKALPVITSVNAVDVLRGFYQSASEELQEQDTNMLVPFDVYNAYCEGYLADFGAVAYNTEFNQTTLVGSNGRCKLAPISAMAGTQHILLTTKSNMLIGCDQMSDEEKVEVRRCDNPKVVQFFMLAYFGVQFESISPERLMVGKIATE